MIYYDPTGHFNIFSGSDWKGFANNAKEVTIGVADGTIRFVSQGTYQSVGNFTDDIKWAYNNNEYLADGTYSYFSETASGIKQNVVNAGNDIRWAYNNRDLVAEMVNEEVQQFKSDVKWAMDNKDLVAQTTNEMATYAINDFNSKSLREKTAIITDGTLNVASFIGVPETAITKVAQIQKLDKLYDAVNLMNKMDDLYDAGMGMKRLDGFADTITALKKSDSLVEASTGIRFADNIDDFGKVGIPELPKNAIQKNYLEVTRAGNNVGGGVPKKTSFGDVIRKLEEPVTGIGTYDPVGGHHIYSKAAFKNHPNYDPDTAMTLSQNFMSSRGWTHHPDMARMQRQMFDNLADSRLPNTLKQHTRVAVESLRAGGATFQEARSLTAKALWDLRKQGVRYPTRIPWN